MKYSVNDYSWKKIYNAVGSMLYNILLPLGVGLYFVSSDMIAFAILFLIGWIGTAFPFNVP